MLLCPHSYLYHKGTVKHSYYYFSLKVEENEVERGSTCCPKFYNLYVVGQILKYVWIVENRK